MFQSEKHSPLAIKIMMRDTPHPGKGLREIFEDAGLSVSQAERKPKSLRNLTNTVA